MSRESPGPAPVVCTLSSKQRTRRALEWTQLSDLSLSLEPIEHGVRATFPLGLADDIESLVTQEATCCGSWLSLSLTHDAGNLALTATTTNPDGVAMIRSTLGIEAP